MFHCWQLGIWGVLKNTENKSNECVLKWLVVLITSRGSKKFFFSRLQTLCTNGILGLLSYEFLCLCLLTPISVKQNTKLWDMPTLQVPAYVGNILTFSCFPNLSN